MVLKKTNVEEARLKVAEEAVTRREKVRTNLYETLEHVTDLDDKNLVERSKKIEMSIYNTTIRRMIAMINNPTKKPSFPKKNDRFKDIDQEFLDEWGYTQKKEIKMPVFKKAKTYKLKANWECYVFKTMYINKAMGILSNLKDTRNPDLLKPSLTKQYPCAK